MLEPRVDVYLGGVWTSMTASGEDFFMAENGQGEDRLIMFAMSKFNIVLLLYHIIKTNYIHIELLERSFIKVGETGVGKQGYGIEWGCFSSHSLARGVSTACTRACQGSHVYY